MFRAKLQLIENKTLEYLNNNEYLLFLNNNIGTYKIKKDKENTDFIDYLKKDLFISVRFRYEIEDLYDFYIINVKFSNKYYCEEYNDMLEYKKKQEQYNEYNFLF